MAIINYYEKYGFSQTDELEKIQWVINQKITDEENDSFGEGHSDRIFILQLAKETFATAQSKAKYDQDLADSMKRSDPAGERKASLEKWHSDSKNYYANRQYDLAKTAIDRAMQYATPETVDSAFYDTAANVYSVLKLFSQALDLHNQSIVLSPDNANGYFLKSVTLYYYMFEKNLGNDRMQDIWQQLKATCNLTISKVIAQGHGYNQASKCYEFLAEMHYVYASTGVGTGDGGGIILPVYESADDGGGAHFPTIGNDNALAEGYALKALSIMNALPNDCPTAKKILDDISARRAKVAELEQVNANLRSKLKQDNDELERQNTNLHKNSYSQKNSIDNATTYGSTDFGGAAGFGAIAGIVGLIALIAGAVGFGVLCIFVAIATFAIKGGIVAKNKNIRDVLASINENQQKINNNTYQMNNNKTAAEKQIRQNDNVIAQQNAGLAPESSVKIPSKAIPKGTEFRMGYIVKISDEGQPYPDKKEEDLYAPVVLVTSKVISDILEIRHLLEAAIQRGKDILIVAENVTGEALAALYVNKLRGTFNSMPVKAVDKSDIQKIAALTGGQVILSDLKATTIEYLGRARMVTVSADKIVIVPWAA